MAGKASKPRANTVKNPDRRNGKAWKLRGCCTRRHAPPRCDKK